MLLLNRKVIFTLLYGFVSIKAQAISLDEVIVTALNNFQSPIVDLERRRLVENRSKAQKWQVSARPSVNLDHDGDEFSAERLAIDTSVDMNASGRLYAGFSRQHLPISDRTILQQNIEYALPLFKRPVLDDINNPKVIDKELKKLERRLIRSQQQLVLEVAELFIQAVAADIKVTDSVARLEAMEERYSAVSNSTSQRVREYSVSELQLAEMHFHTESAQLNAAELRSQLEGLIRESLGDEKLEIPKVISVADDLDDLIYIALEHRLDYADAIDSIERASKVARLNRRFNIPEVTMRFGYSASQYDGGDSDSNNERFNLGLSGGDFLTGAKEDKKHFQYELERARIERQVLEQQVRSDVASAYLQLNNERRSLELKERQLKHFEEQLKGYRKLHHLGRTPYSEVEAMVAKVDEARQSFALTQQESILASYRLKAATGTLVDTPAYLLPAVSQTDSTP